MARRPANPLDRPHAGTHPINPMTDDQYLESSDSSRWPRSRIVSRLCPSLDAKCRARAPTDVRPDGFRFVVFNLLGLTEANTSCHPRCGCGMQRVIEKFNVSIAPSYGDQYGRRGGTTYRRVRAAPNRSSCIRLPPQGQHGAALRSRYKLLITTWLSRVLTRGVSHEHRNMKVRLGIC
nr:hypothetical protein CFP56_00205 [Quercus suber]